MEVHRGKLANGRRLDEQVQGLALVDECPAVGSHVDQRPHRDLPGGAVDLFEVVGDDFHFLDGAFSLLDVVSYGLGPEPTLPELGHQVAVDLEELAGEGFPLEHVGHLRFYALVAAGDRGDGGRRRNGDHQRITQPVGGDAFPQGGPTLGVGRLHPPEVELEGAGRRPGLVEVGVWPELLGQLRRGPQGVEVDLFGDPTGQVPGFRGVEGQAQLEEHVLKAHEAQAHRTPGVVGVLRLGGGVVVDVDYPVQERHGDTDYLGEALEVEGPVDHQGAEVHRAQVAHSGL